MTDLLYGGGIPELARKLAAPARRAAHDRVAGLFADKQQRGFFEGGAAGGRWIESSYDTLCDADLLSVLHLRLGFPPVRVLSPTCLLCGKGDTSTPASVSVHALSCSDLQGVLTSRHHRVKRAMQTHLLAALRKAGGKGLYVATEVHLNALGFKARDHAAAAVAANQVSKTGIPVVADVAVQYDVGSTSRTVAIDLVVSGPSTTFGPAMGAGEAAKLASADKVRRYVSNWHMTEGRDIRPYAMEPSGLAHLDDYRGLKTLVFKAAPATRANAASVHRDISKSFARLLTHIAVALQRGNALVLQIFSRRWQLVLDSRAAAAGGGGRGAGAGAGAGR